MGCWDKYHKEESQDVWNLRKKKVESNPIYRLLDQRMGGSLVQALEEYGEDGVRRLCLSEIKDQFLYNKGEKHFITQAEYSVWRLTRENGGAQAIHIHEPEVFSQFKEHDACWHLNTRGEDGETILHICFWAGTPIHTEIARILLNVFPNLALDIVEGEEYYGQSALHLAIVQGDLASVKILVENGANVNQAATGKFFLPESQKRKLNKSTNYEGYAYYGEYPLSFAACLGHEAIYDYLIQRGADPNNQDRFGNTVLHMVVIQNKQDMYSHAIRHPIKAANAWIRNGQPGSKNGLTPLALASKLGRKEIFNEIIEHHKIELWRYSNICCSLYPLYAIDSIDVRGNTNWSSALMIIVNGETDDHLEMLQGGVIRQLLDEKWKTFIKKRFFIELCLMALHLIMLLLAVVLRTHKDINQYSSSEDITRILMEIIVIIFCVFNLGKQYEEIKALGFISYLTNMKNVPMKPFFLLSCTLVLCCVPLRIVQLATVEPHLVSSNVTHTDPEALKLYEESLLIIAVPCAWIMLLFFATLLFPISRNNGREYRYVSNFWWINDILIQDDS